MDHDVKTMSLIYSVISWGIFGMLSGLVITMCNLLPIHLNIPVGIVLFGIAGAAVGATRVKRGE